VQASGESVILFRVAGWRFGVNAVDVKEIRELDPHWRDEKDGAVTIRLGEELGLKARGEHRVLMLRGLDVGIAVDEVEKMTVVREVLPLPAIFRGREREWYTGLLVLEGLVVPLLNSMDFAFRSGSAASPGARQ